MSRADASRPPWTSARAVIGAPSYVAVFLESSALVYGVGEVVVRLSEPDCAIFWMTVAPLPAAAAEGYPDERISIAVWSNTHHRRPP